MSSSTEHWRHRSVPRYTSYPTALQFGATVDRAVHASWLQELPAGGRASAYLHIPFCAVLCHYCGCHTTAVNRHQPVAEYARLLEREIELVGSLVQPVELSAVHWGGGTPSMLCGRELADITAALAGHFRFAADVEIAAELDPRILTRAKVGEFAAVGLNRASLGVQDFDARVQKVVNRIQPYTVTRDAVGWLRAEGITGINLDLMYGLPFQTVETVLATVDQAAGLAPDRMALFGYAHVPWMKKHQKLLPEEALPSPAERLAQSEAAAQRLVEHGYVRVGLDHFARPEDPMAQRLAQRRLRRNFQGYTTDESATLLGFGISAISTLPRGYAQNTADATTYRARIEGGQLATARGIELSLDDRLRRDVIETLMCALQVDLAEVANRHRCLAETFSAALASLRDFENDGMVYRKGWLVRITERGRPLVRAICTAFDAYFQAGVGRHSTAV